MMRKEEKKVKKEKKRVNKVKRVKMALRMKSLGRKVLMKRMNILEKRVWRIWRIWVTCRIQRKSQTTKWKTKRSLRKSSTR